MPAKPHESFSDELREIREKLLQLQKDAEEQDAKRRKKEEELNAKAAELEKEHERELAELKEQRERELAELKEQFKREELVRLERQRVEAKRAKLAKVRDPTATARRMHQGMTAVLFPPNTTLQRIQELAEHCRAEKADGEWDYAYYHHSPRPCRSDKSFVAFFFTDKYYAVQFKLLHGGSV